MALLSIQVLSARATFNLIRTFSRPSQLLTNFLQLSHTDVTDVYNKKSKPKTIIGNSGGWLNSPILASG